MDIFHEEKKAVRASKNLERKRKRASAEPLSENEVAEVLDFRDIFMLTITPEYGETDYSVYSTKELATTALYTAIANNPKVANAMNGIIKLQLNAGPNMHVLQKYLH